MFQAHRQKETGPRYLLEMECNVVHLHPPTCTALRRQELTVHIFEKVLAGVIIAKLVVV